MRKILLILITLMAGLSTQAFAQGKYLNLSVDGNWANDNEPLYVYTKKIIGGEIAIPISDYFQISAAHTITQERTVYFEAYRQYLLGLGQNVPKSGPPLTTSTDTVDTTADAGLSYPMGPIFPSIFGGELWRTVNYADIYTQYPTQKQITWNAGVSLGVYITTQLRFKASYRISPSQLSKKIYDTQSTLGLTWGI